MTTTRATLILTCAILLGLSACRDKVPCADCGGGFADDDTPVQDIPMSDLPCGGADLMTENLNCGICGHECGLFYPGTPYEAGGCKAGVCGPGGWTSCDPKDADDPYENCAEVCAAYSRTCVANGCAGLTGMMSDVLFGNGCGPGENGPLAEFSGSCEDPIPWMTPAENLLHVQCCCEYQQSG